MVVWAQFGAKKVTLYGASGSVAGGCSGARPGGQRGGALLLCVLDIAFYCSPQFQLIQLIIDCS